MRTAAEAAEKFVARAQGASQDYLDGATRTSKDQSTAAIAAKAVYAQAVQEAITRGAYEKGLSKSGKAGWEKGVREKGSVRYAGGVAAGREAYVANSSRYDSARGAAASMPRGPRGSEANYARGKAVGVALRAVKVGK